MSRRAHQAESGLAPQARNALPRLPRRLNAARALQYLDKVACRDRNVPARWQRLRHAHANVRAATAHPSRQWVSAIPSQDVDLLGLAQCARSAPAVPDGRARIFQAAWVVKNRHEACKVAINETYSDTMMSQAVCHVERSAATKCEA